MSDAEYVNLGEGAGHYELVSRRAYDEVYNDLKTMLEKEGVAAVLNYKPDWRVTPRRQALVASIVKKLPDGKVHLRTADEWAR